MACNPLPQLGDTIRILDTDLQEHTDTFRIALIETCKKSLFPELVEIFGASAAVKFMDIFGGMTIKVPDRTILENAVRNTEIYLSLKKNNTPENAVRLAQEYGLSVDYVRDVYQVLYDRHRKLGLL